MSRLGQALATLFALVGASSIVVAKSPAARAGRIAQPPTPPTDAPAAARPHAELDEWVPVLLVPGWSDGRAELEPLRTRFVDAGWDPDRVAIVDFRDPVGSNREHAREIALAAAALRADTGVPRIDIVAHSMGGLALRYHLQRQRSPTLDIRRIVFLATPHFGTYSSLVAWGEGAREMLPGSDFLLSLMNGPPIPEGIEALSIWTPFDLHVLPHESAVMPGIHEERVCCPSHAGLLDDPLVFERVEAFLRPQQDDEGL